MFALPQPVKDQLNKEAIENVKEYEIETYGKEITDDDLAEAGINVAWYRDNPDTPLAQKALLDAGIIKEKDVAAPIVNMTNIEPKGNIWGQLAAAPFGLAGFGNTSMADYIREDLFTKPNTYTGQEWLDKQASDKATALKNVQADNTLNDSQKIQLTDFINNPPDMTTGLLDQNNLSLSDMVVNENFDTGVNPDHRSVDVLNSLAEPNTSSNYLQRLFGFNK